MASIRAVLLLVSSLLASAVGYNTSLTLCGSPSNPKTTLGYECTGALFTGVDINQLNTLKNEAGCVAGMLGLSTQLKGYHCLAFKNCPGSSCTCEVRQGCSSSTAILNATMACLYGVSDVAKCPADVPAGSSVSSSAASHCSTGFLFLLFASCVLLTDASYNTSLSNCGSPSNPKSTSGYECSGALFTGVDINQFNTLKNEKGCVAGMLGLTTQLKGYHCLAFKNCPGSACTCEVRQGCSSSKAAVETTRACLYGVSEASECPADVQGAATSSTSSRSGTILIGMSIALLGVVMASVR